MELSRKEIIELSVLLQDALTKLREVSNDQFLSKAEVASILTMSKSSIDRLVASGVLIPYRFPGNQRVYFKRREVFRSLQPQPVQQAA